MMPGVFPHIQSEYPSIYMEGNDMPRYVIERAIPDIGSAEREALRGASQKSNSVLAAMKAENKNIQWEHSYVAGDRTFCIYIADDEALIHEHAERSGFPATVVTPVRKMIDPVTAEG
jgi:hypothetical protein